MSRIPELQANGFSSDSALAHQTDYGPKTASETLVRVAFASATAILIALSVMLCIPFLPAITWSVALAIIALPMHRWVNRQVKSSSLSAGISTLIVVAVILIPGFFVAYQLANETGSVAAAQAESASNGHGLRQTLSDLPALGGLATWLERVGVDLEVEIRHLIRSSVPELSAFATGTMEVGIQLLAAIFMLFYLFRDRHAFLRKVQDLLPLSHQESERVFERAAESVHANVYATITTSLVDAVSGGIVFWLVGLPSPLLWTVVMFVLSVLPIVGAGLVWVPAAAYLMMKQQALAGLAVLAWGTCCFVIVDNIIYVRLAGGRMRMHPVPALIAFLGGLAVFGLSGMILGPAILAVTVAVLEVWQHRRAALPETGVARILAKQS